MQSGCYIESHRASQLVMTMFLLQPTFCLEAAITMQVLQQPGRLAPVRQVAPRHAGNASLQVVQPVPPTGKQGSLPPLPTAKMLAGAHAQ